MELASESVGAVLPPQYPRGRRQAAQQARKRKYITDIPRCQEKPSRVDRDQPVTECDTGSLLAVLADPGGEGRHARRRRSSAIGTRSRSSVVLEIVGFRLAGRVTNADPKRYARDPANALTTSEYHQLGAVNSQLHVGERERPFDPVEIVARTAGNQLGLEDPNEIRDQLASRVDLLLGR